MLLVPTALAASDLTAATIRLTGSSILYGEEAAVFTVAGDAPFTWTLTASAAEMTRLHATYAAVVHPLNPQQDGVYETDWEESHEDFGAITLTSTGLTPDGALLAMGDGTSVDVITSGFVDLEAVESPEVSKAQATAQAGDDGELRERLPGSYIRADISDATILLSGDITLLLHGPTYTLESGDIAREERSGEHDDQGTAVAALGTNEFHRFTLQDAVLELRAPAGAQTYTRLLHVELDGALDAHAADGALLFGGIARAPADDGTLAYDGEASLDLAPGGGRLLASAPDTLATASVPATPGAPRSILTFALLGVALTLAAAGAFLYARRRMAGDDLDVALLAMNERRWEDALPRLTRLAKKQPANAGVQIDRALCLEQVGRFEDAAKAFEAALRAAPTHAEAHFYYARTLAKMREREAARVHLETALERDPRLVEMVRAEPMLKGL